jgi:hypothetical protein
MTLLILAVLPVLVTLVFQRSENATREWVGAGLDLDIELLQLVSSQSFRQTRMGSCLQELTARFPGPVVADMFCLLRVELECRPKRYCWRVKRVSSCRSIPRR